MYKYIYIYIIRYSPAHISGYLLQTCHYPTSKLRLMPAPTVASPAIHTLHHHIGLIASGSPSSLGGL